MALLGIPGLGTAELLIIIVLVALLIVPIWFLWKVFERAGLSPALALLILLPFGALITLAILAFSEWPALTRPGNGPLAAPAGVTALPAPVAAAAWLPDPLGSHKLRYWDGRNWTDSFNDD